jgi:hypothetical protein
MFSRLYAEGKAPFGADYLISSQKIPTIAT